MENNVERRRPGRPQGFDPDQALDLAIELFWANGFDGVEIEQIARAVGVTKPSVYRHFGDKASLFLHAVRRYGQTEGVKPLIAFQQEPDISAAILAFFKAAVLAATTEGRPTGCLVACVACGYADRSEDVRTFFGESLRQLGQTLEARLAAEIGSGHLPSSISAKTRAHIMVDIVQGIAIRARAGIKREELLADISSYAALVSS